MDEAFHESARAAAFEALAGRGEEYVRARRALARAHVPERLETEVGDGSWAEVARLAELAIDDALLALLGSDLLHPKHVRELYRSFQALAS